MAAIIKIKQLSQYRTTKSLRLSMIAKQMRRSDLGGSLVITDDAGHEKISVYCNRHQCSFIAVAERCGAFNIDGLSNWFEAGLGCSKGKLGQGAHKKLWKSLVAQTR